MGVVADVRSAGLARPVRPEIYLPVRQQSVWNQLYVLLRAERAVESVLPAVRQAVVSLDPDQPIYAIQTLEDAMNESVFQQRISAALIGLFASIAIVLAAIGIYGVMAYTVSARTREMGVRLALGAQRRDLIWLVLRQVFGLAAIGLALGLGGLAVGGFGLRRLLFGVTAADPLTIAGVTATLGAVAIAAGWLPAWRASRVDPIQALRCE